MCQWHNSFLNNIDWTLHSGYTTSLGTGPRIDHTFMNVTGHYLYMETSIGSQGDMANLTSPLFKPNSAILCFNFYYHMFGTNVGNLSVLYHAAGSKTMTVLYSKTGNQGIFWLRGSAKLPINKQNYHLIVAGTRGNGFQGDIGLDDFSFNNCTQVSRELENMQRTICRGRRVWDRQIDRQTDRQADRQTHRQTDRQTHRHTEKNRNRQYLVAIIIVLVFYSNWTNWTN